MELTKKQEEERVYFVYSHVNLINNKIYIGITKQIPSYRWGSQGQGYKDSPKFWNAIQKYGWDNFEHNILFSELTKDEACEKEIELIKKYNSNNSNYGYNMTSGGEKHYAFNETVKQKLREQKLGENNPMFGTHRTKEQKEQQSIRMIGGQNPSAKRVICIETNIIYDCCRDAAEALGKDRIQGGKTISRCALGHRKTAYNLHWRYENDIN